MSAFILADLLSSIRVGILARKLIISGPVNKLSIRILSILLELGYIGGFSVDKKNYKVYIFLKYSNRKSAIRQIYIINRPSKPVYIKKKSLFGAYLNNFNIQNGFMLISTSRGVVTDVEAHLLGIGGVPIV